MPGLRCTVAVCNNSLIKTKSTAGLEHVKYHTFPTDIETRKVWVNKCRRDGKCNSDSCHVCSMHFTEDDFERDLKTELLNIPKKRILKKGAIPSLNLVKAEIDDQHAKRDVEKSARNERRSKKRKRELVHEILEQSQEIHSPTTPGSNFHDFSADDYPIFQQDLTGNQDSRQGGNETEQKLRDAEEKLKNYEAEIQKLRSQLQFSQEHATRLKLKVSTLQRELKAITKLKLPRNVIDGKVHHSLLKIFTESQVQVLMHAKKRVNWGNDDMSLAFTLRYLSKRAYIYLRKTQHYPLPGISTLQHWASKINVGNGLLTDVLLFMRIAALGKEPYQKVAIIQFDEVKVKESYEYNQMTDEVVGPHKQMQVALVRGLFENWKQPIFVDFDKQMSPETLKSIINSVEDSGYDVRGMVCDMGGGNQGLWKKLGISVDQPWFTLDPVKNKKIHAFADTPHLLKLLRNWFLDTGFTLVNGDIVNADPGKKLVELDNREFKVCHKLTTLHIECAGAKRQNVRLAAQLMSHTTATALKSFTPGEDKSLAFRTGEFIETVNDWFDVLNSYIPNFGGRREKCGYGLCKNEQDRKLDKMYDVVNTMRCGMKKSLQVFQKGILIGIKSIKGLFEDVASVYDTKYILTHRVNQDALENFFSQIRTRGGLNDHPTALNALYRIRMIILGKNPGIIQKKVNTESQSTDEYMTSNIFRVSGITVSNLQDLVLEDFYSEVSVIKETAEDNPPIQTSANPQPANPTPTPLTAHTKRPVYMTEMESDGLEYVAGWLAKKYKQKYPKLGDHTCNLKIDHAYTKTSWIQQLSYGGLIQPRPEFMSLVYSWNVIFIRHHGTVFAKGVGVMKNVSKKIQADFPKAERDIINSFVRIRTFIRIKMLIKKLEANQHLKMAKKNTELSIN